MMSVANQTLSSSGSPLLRGLMLFAGAADAKPVLWKIDTAHTQAMFKVKHLGIKHLQEELRISPNDNWAMMQLAFEYIKRSEYESAITWARKALRPFAVSATRVRGFFPTKSFSIST